MTAVRLEPAARAPRTARVLHPGDVGAGGAGARFETLLGSCVAVILADPRRTFGAMCHYVHTRTGAGGEDESGAYAPAALRRMYALLRANGLQPRLCDAWIVGGGNMFPGLVQRRHVGDDNVQWAFDALAEDRVRVVGSNVGGNAYRRLAWTVGPGAPEVQLLEV
jgi:chemotaxis protein CheD